MMRGAGKLIPHTGGRPIGVQEERQLCAHLDAMAVLVNFIYAYVQRAGMPMPLPSCGRFYSVPHALCGNAGPEYQGEDEAGDEGLAIMLNDDDIDQAVCALASEGPMEHRSFL
jgi:hypothetical protein